MARKARLPKPKPLTREELERLLAEGRKLGDEVAKELRKCTHPRRWPDIIFRAA